MSEASASGARATMADMGVGLGPAERLDVLDVLPAAVAVWDKQERLVYANQTHQRWYDSAAAVARNATVQEVLRPEIYERARPFLDAVALGQECQFLGLRKRLIHLLPRRDADGALCGHITVSVENTVQRELVLNNARLAALVNNSQDAIFSVDNDGLVQTWNPGAERMFGFTAGEIIGRPFDRLVPQDLMAEALAVRARVRQGELVSPFDTVRLHKDGHAVPVSASIFPVLDDWGRVLRISAILRDISPLKASEAALRASEQRFRVLAEASPLGIYHTDAEGGCTYTNAAWQGIYGMGLAASLGRGWTRTLHPDDAAAVYQTWSNTAARGLPFEMQFRIRHDDGKVRHVNSRANALRDDEGAVSGFVGAVEDITERVLAEAALRSSRQRLRQLYDATPALLYSCDVQGRLLSASDTWLNKLGHARDEVLGRPQEDFMAEPSRALWRHTVWPRLLREGRIAEVPLRLRKRSGEPIDVVLAAFVDVGSDDSNSTRVLAVMEDVTAALRHGAELQRERLLRQEIARRADELQALLAERDQMLNVLAHEVRQPLNNASAALQGAQASLGQGDASLRHRLARAAQVLSEVSAGVDNTLAAASLLASDEVLEVEDADVDLLLALCLGDLDPAERSRVRIQRDTATRTAPMDMSLMRLALRNLLVNALRYSGAGTSVTVVVSDSDEPLALIIEVRDEGQGFDTELVQHLFERGRRGRAGAARAVAGGSGLGLYIVRRVLQRHGGTAQLVNNVPGDVRMRLTLPPPGDA